MRRVTVCQGTFPGVHLAVKHGGILRNVSVPEDEAIEVSLIEDINSVLDTLTEKEAEIIQFRFGLNGRSPLSLKEIGDRYNLTKERIRQIEAKALRKLRHPTRSYQLRSFLLEE